MAGDPIDWPALCESGAFLAVRVVDAADECRRAGCSRAVKHAGPHNGQPVKKRPKPKPNRNRNEWTYG